MSSNKTSQPSRKTFVPSTSHNILQRQTTLGVHQAIQREAAGSAIHEGAPNLVRSVVNSPGYPLDAPTRSFMEPRLGHDFSNVRIHTDRSAAESARAVEANAYTTRNHIVFGANKYSPGTTVGNRLLAHELTHVVQQARGPVAGTSIADGLQVNHSSDKFEQDAELHATSVMADWNKPVLSNLNSQLSPTHSGATLQLQRQTLEERQTVAAESSASAAGTSATAGVVSAGAGIGQAIGGIGSAIAAFLALGPAQRAAQAAERQAEAAENPPVGTPTTGGIAVTHVDVPNVNAPQSSTVTAGAEEDTPKKLLKISQGMNNFAELNLNLRKDGKNITGGSTEDGVAQGYLGGSTGSNLSATFRASPGAPVNGRATVRVLFSGTNVPPRSSQTIQRFSGNVKFDAAGNTVSRSVNVNPQGPPVYGDGNDQPIATFGFTPGGTSAATPLPQGPRPQGELNDMLDPRYRPADRTRFA